jgi:hypothetical protein
MESVKDLDQVLSTIKDNVGATRTILKGWEKNLMFERKEGKVYTFDELNEAFAALIQQRHAEIRDGGKEITKLLSSSNRVLKVSKGMPAWRAYVDYFSAVVIDGFCNAITATARYLLAQARCCCGTDLCLAAVWVGQGGAERMRQQGAALSCTAAPQMHLTAIAAQHVRNQ